MFYTYVIESDSYERLYIGSTNSVEIRLEKHNEGKVISTKAYRPWRVVGTEEFKSRREAIKREKYLKSLKNPKYIKRLINGPVV